MNELEMLEAALAGKHDQVESGYKTARQFAKEWGLRESQTRHKLCDGVNGGFVFVKIFRIQNGLRGIYPVPHYKLCVNQKRNGR